MRHERCPSLSAEDTVRPVVAPVRAGVALRGIAGLRARVLAFWFGSLCVVNVLAGLRHPTFDPNIWWIDLRFLPKPGGQLLLLSVGALLVGHGLRALGDALTSTYPVAAPGTEAGSSVL